MEISVTRYYDKNKNKVDGTIEKADWVSYNGSSPLLSAETAPLRGRHPATGAEMLIAPRADVGYFKQGGERVAIQYNDGDLWTECEWDDTAKSVLGEIAKHFGAVLLDEDGEVITM